MRPKGAWSQGEDCCVLGSLYSHGRLSRLPQTYNPYGIPQKQDAWLPKALGSIKIATKQQRKKCWKLEGIPNWTFLWFVTVSERPLLCFQVVAQIPRDRWGSALVLFRWWIKLGRVCPSSTQSISCFNEGDLAWYASKAHFGFHIYTNLSPPPKNTQKCLEWTCAGLNCQCALMQKKFE